MNGGGRLGGGFIFSETDSISVLRILDTFSEGILQIKVTAKIISQRQQLTPLNTILLLVLTRAYSYYSPDVNIRDRLVSSRITK